jgi:hypothetical protein
MPALTRSRPPERRHEKITLGEMRASGVRGLLIYCSDYRCSHSTAISGDRWPDHVRLSDLEARFVCRACGTQGAVRRPDDVCIGVMRAMNRLKRELNPSRKYPHCGRRKLARDR